jgi:hypothetical protein
MYFECDVQVQAVLHSAGVCLGVNWVSLLRYRCIRDSVSGSVFFCVAYL